MVDATAQQVAGGVRGLTEIRALLFSALMLADKLHDAGGTVALDKAEPTAAMMQAADTLEVLATRLENLALRLEN
jgi:hypothetical protein